MFWAKNSKTNCERTRSLLLFLPEIFKKNLKFLSPVLNMWESHYEHRGVPFWTLEHPKWTWWRPTLRIYSFLKISLIVGRRQVHLGRSDVQNGTPRCSQWDSYMLSTGLRNFQFFLNISGRKRSRNLVLSQLVLEFFGSKTYQKLV